MGEDVGSGEGQVWGTPTLPIRNLHRGTNNGGTPRNRNGTKAAGCVGARLAPRRWEAEAGESDQGHSPIHSALEATLGYMRHCLSKTPPLKKPPTVPSMAGSPCSIQETQPRTVVTVSENRLPRAGLCTKNAMLIGQRPDHSSANGGEWGAGSRHPILPGFEVLFRGAGLGSQALHTSASGGAVSDTLVLGNSLPETLIQRLEGPQAHAECLAGGSGQCGSRQSPPLASPWVTGVCEPGTLVLSCCCRCPRCLHKHPAGSGRRCQEPGVQSRTLFLWWGSPVRAPGPALSPLPPSLSS